MAACAIRAHDIDQLVKRHISEHKHPVVVELGAGMSSRYYRVKEENPELRWIELDLDDVIALRRELDAETEQHRFIPRSVFDYSWMDELPQSTTEELLFVAEGLFMYFKREWVETLVAEMCSRFSGASLVFDTTGVYMDKMNRLYRHAGMEAQLQWLVKDRREIERLGLQVEKSIPLFRGTCGRCPIVTRALSWLPKIRQALVITSAKLKPQVDCAG